LKADTSATNATEFVNVLLLQIRELTSTNLDLRSSLKEQSGTIVELQAEHERLRNEIRTGSSKPSSERKPSRKQPAP
jgi:septal ring factor EnvC (AmiA/AmiB activator)